MKLKALSLTLAAMMLMCATSCTSSSTSSSSSKSSSKSTSEKSSDSSSKDTSATDSSDASSKEAGTASSYSTAVLGKDNTDIKADLKVLTQRTDLIDTVFAGYIKKFQAMYPNVKISYEGITDYDGDMTTRLTSGDWGDICGIPTTVEKASFLLTSLLLHLSANSPTSTNLSTQRLTMTTFTAFLQQVTFRVLSTIRQSGKTPALLFFLKLRTNSLTTSQL